MSPVINWVGCAKYGFLLLSYLLKFAFTKCVGYLRALKNSGDPEKDNGETGPTVIKGYSFLFKLL